LPVNNPDLSALLDDFKNVLEFIAAGGFQQFEEDRFRAGYVCTGAGHFIDADLAVFCRSRGDGIGQLIRTSFLWAEVY